MAIVRALLIVLALALTGCAMNPRFDSSLPSDRIDGEQECEVPQHWKALALEGVDSMELARATVVQVRMPAEWVGDAFGWPVPVGDTEVKYLPRLSWSALLVLKTGEKRFYPAIAKNPLVSPYMTVIIPDLSQKEVRGSQLIILSGARTKALTLQREVIGLRGDQSCVSSIDADFFSKFSSVVKETVEINEQKGTAVLSDIKKTFPWSIKTEDGRYYSLHTQALTPEVAGDMRQATFEERFVTEGGGKIIIPSPLGTLGSNVIAGAFALQGKHVGPFGEREYSPDEARYLLAGRFRGYVEYVHALERRLGRSESDVLGLPLAFAGMKTGWSIARDLFLDIEDMWSQVEKLEKEVLAQRKGGRL